MKPTGKRVLVMHEAIDGPARADEQDTLVQVEQVSAALEDLGCEVSTLGLGLDLEGGLRRIRERRPDAVFNLVESLAGDGRLIHIVPAVLASAGMAFTGCGSDSIYLSSQKRLAKRWMRLNGIDTPADLADGEGAADSRWIVKSLWEHASFGLDDGCVVRGPLQARARIAACRKRYGGEWFAERFVDGREFNISVLEQDGRASVLPLAEMTFVDYPADKPKIVGYAAKWEEQAPEYQATRRCFPVLDAALAARLRETARKCWDSFGLRGYARVDVRLDSTGRPWVLEVNANPCLARDAGFPEAALRAGLSYTRLVRRIVGEARPRVASGRCLPEPLPGAKAS